MARPEKEVGKQNGTDLTDAFAAMGDEDDASLRDTVLKDVTELRAKAEAEEDENPTEKNPALNEDGGSVINLPETDDAPTIRSLNQLEVDLKQLQSSWHSVEKQLAAKDNEIAYLHDERDMHVAAFKSLQLELDEQLDEHQELLDSLGAVQESLKAAEARLSNHDAELADKHAELEAALAAKTALDADYREALDTCEWLKDSVAKSNHERKVADDLRADIEKNAVKLKVEIQSLEDYIDGRKAEWDALHKDLADCRSALSAMERELQNKEAALAAHEEEKSALTSAIVELQNRCAELDGRRAEREATNRELNELVAQKGTEIQSLTRELADAQEGSEATFTRMQDQAARIASLEGELTQLDARIKDIRRAADAEVEAAQSAAKTELHKMQERLDAAESSSADALNACAAAERRADALDADVRHHDEIMAQLRDANAALEGRLIDESQRVTQLRDELSVAHEAERALQVEYEDHQRRSAEKLEAHMELVSELEGELERRNAAIALLQKNAATLGRIQEDVQELDARISSGSRDHSVSRTAAAGAKQLLVVVKGMPEIKFPIYKHEMTIGRSRDNDIQLRRKCISREHARLIQDDDRTLIRDSGSKNGLYVNDEPVTEHYLADGDRIDIGEVQFRYMQSGELT